MYIKLTRYSTYNLDIFFDKDDKLLDKIKIIVFSGNHASTNILIQNRKIQIEYLPIDVYKLSFIDDEVNFYTSKYNYGLICYNYSSDKDQIKAKNIDIKDLLSTNHKIKLGKDNEIIWNFDIDNLISLRLIYDILGCIPQTNNITRFIREIGKLVNYNDDYGIISGCWKKNVKLNNNRSLFDVLQILFNTRNNIIYGQCFTFAAVLCGILRNINIPSRCITCYNACHDGNIDGDITQKQGNFDRFIDNPDKNTDDFRWNFHVWVECYIKGKWYAIDSSPVYRNELNECIIGPSCIDNIKNNNYLDTDNYDVNVFSSTVDNIKHKFNNIYILTYYKNKLTNITKNYRNS